MGVLIREVFLAGGVDFIERGRLVAPACRHPCFLGAKSLQQWRPGRLRNTARRMTELVAQIFKQPRHLGTQGRMIAVVSHCRGRGRHTVLGESARLSRNASADSRVRMLLVPLSALQERAYCA